MNAYRFVAASFFYRFLSWKETKKKISSPEEESRAPAGVNGLCVSIESFS